MSSTICANCGSLNIAITTPDILKFKCIRCETETKHTNIDTLTYRNSKFNGFHVELLKNICKDPINPLIKSVCSNCKYEWAKEVVVGDDMKYIQQCLKCNKITSK